MGLARRGARRALGMRWGRHDGVYSVDVAIRWRAAEGGASRSADVAIRWRATAESEGPSRSVAQRAAMMYVTRGGHGKEVGKRGGRGRGGLGGFGAGLPVHSLVIDVRMFHVKHSAAQHAAPRIVGA